MKLVYRAVKYQTVTFPSEFSTTIKCGTYRGKSWAKSSLSAGRISQAKSRLKYRGIDYLA